MKTVLITGCSSGFGLATADHFLAQGWRVVATMRRPDPAVLPASDRLTILPLDVTDDASIAACLAAAGPVDVLVNNAGIGLLNALEGVPMATVRAIFEANTLGTIAMCQAVLPGMRARGAGAIVNVTSSVTLKTLPLLAVYTASKAAVNAFTASLALELAPLGIRATVVLPGRAPGTRFAANAAGIMGTIPAAYQALGQAVMAGFGAEGPITQAADVAAAIYQAATDPDAPARLPAGADALEWAAAAS